MARPIFLMGFPINADADSVMQAGESVQTLLKDEYHVLIYRAQEIESLSFQVLNAVNATDVEIEELIELVKNQVKSINNKTDDIS